MNRGLTQPKNQQRLVGIDLFRGIAAYAVVLIHAGTLMLYSGFPSDGWTAVLMEMSRFAVPFFLASSFYLMTKKLYVNEHQSSVTSIFKSRSERLLVPYFLWSLIYLSLRVLKTVSESGNISNLFQDPALLIFLGGASIHLYFLPLLFTGSFLIIVAEFLVRHRIRLITLIALSVMSIVIYELQIISGNDFQFFAKFGADCLAELNACSVAWQSVEKALFPDNNDNQILRLVLVAIAWLIKCLPYVLLAMIMNHPAIKKRITNFHQKQALYCLISAILISTLWLMNLFKIFYFPQSIYEIGTAFSLLLCGLALSNKVSQSSYIANLGISSFGIYLIHYLVLTIYITVITKLAPKFMVITPMITILLITTVGFFTSWIIVSNLMKYKTISKTLFSA
ncbi:acyltransferase [Nostoc sp. TCL26-01]|uniref:acyltransferase family protein n=1 Tax=Nostoc sp. TCL26-01 TaxID=2576904 RepID=UPI0015BFDEED|nr:acyltransferase [Nostoc sp. TCL26-01]